MVERVEPQDNVASKRCVSRINYITAQQLYGQVIRTCARDISTSTVLISKHSRSLNQTRTPCYRRQWEILPRYWLRQCERFDCGVTSSGSVRLSVSSNLFEIYSIGSELRKVESLCCSVLICSYLQIGGVCWYLCKLHKCRSCWYWSKTEEAI